MSSEKHQPPYRGFWAVLLTLILVPLVLFAIVNRLMNEYSRFSDALNLASSKVFGFGMGFLFHMMCLVSGSFRPGWNALKYRISEFFLNIPVGLGYAIQTYFEDIRDDGMTFTICLLVIAANLAVTVDALLDALKLLHFL
ncbi:MAG: hypothetical protein IKL25_03965 [Clostridia bacterium]|nr:hypothetical protein [Clostridia bacterium]